MTLVFDHPAIFFPFICIFLFAAGWLGVMLETNRPMFLDAEHASYKTVESSVLGLLALLLGFSFAMAVTRYDLRQSLEVDEANAIGTTWLRTETMDSATKATAQQLLKDYGTVRIGFFSVGTDRPSLAANLIEAGAIQKKLWALAAQNSAEHRDPISGLFLSTLNDTIDLSEKRTAAYENKIPTAAWMLLLVISGASSMLVGVGTVAGRRGPLFILPLIVGAAMTLTLDLDSPRAGFVRVPQYSMQRVVAQMNEPQ
jgi:hypothetical protein